MKYIKIFENFIYHQSTVKAVKERILKRTKDFKEGKYVKFIDSKYSSDDVFKIMSISKASMQAWVYEIKTGSFYWLLLKQLRLLTELELNMLKYNL